MRTLRPACDLIICAVEANNMHRLEDIVGVVVELVKDSCPQLNDINNKGKNVVPNPTIPSGQVSVHASLLPPGAPNQWGAATTIGNPGQLRPNPPPAQIAPGGQRGQAPPGVAFPNVHAAQVNVPAAQVNVPTAGQVGQAPPGAAGPNLLAAHVNVPARLPENSERLLRVRLVQMYLPHKSMSGQPDNSDRLHRVRLVQTHLRHRSTSLLPDKSARLVRVRLVQT